MFYSKSSHPIVLLNHQMCQKYPVELKYIQWPKNSEQLMIKGKVAYIKFLLLVVNLKLFKGPIKDRLLKEDTLKVRAHIQI